LAERAAGGDTDLLVRDALLLSADRSAQGFVKGGGSQDSEELVALQHGHPTGVPLQHRRQCVLQGGVGGNPGVHPLRDVDDGAASLTLVGADPARQVVLVVDDDRPSCASPLELCPSSGQRVVGVENRRMFEVTRVDGRHGQAPQPPIGTDELCHELVGRCSQNSRGCVELRQPAPRLENCNPVTETHSLLDVVCNEHNRLCQVVLNGEELVLQPPTNNWVDGTEGLIHQEHFRVGRQGPGNTHPLALASRQLMGVTVAEFGGVESHRGEQLVDSRAGALLVPARELRNGRNVGADGLMGEKANLLDDVADSPTQLHRVDLGDVLPVQLDAPGCRFDQSVDHLECGGLATTRWSDQRHEGAARHVQVEFLHGHIAAGISLADAVQPDHQIFATVHRVTLLPASAPQAAETPQCYIDNSWWCPFYWSDRQELLAGALKQHVSITVASVALGLLIAFPLALLARRFGRLETLVVGGTTIIYTIPSLALFSLLLPATGLSATTVIIGLALYSLTILVRSLLVGLRGVSEDVRESAVGNGYGQTRLLFTIELPLALPVIMAGLRVATVSTVALVTVGSIVSYGGLGNLLLQAVGNQFKAQILAASVLCVLLAVVLDILLVILQRLLTPWTRTGARV